MPSMGGADFWITMERTVSERMSSDYTCFNCVPAARRLAEKSHDLFVCNSPLGSDFGRSIARRLLRPQPGLLLRSFRLGALLLQLLGRIHASAAALAAAIARRIVVAVVQPVIVSEFLAGGDIAQRNDVHPVVFLIRLTVGIARMVHEHCHSVSVDDHLTIADSKQVRERPAVVSVIALSFGDALACIFQDACAFGNAFQRETSGGVNVRGSNDEAQQKENTPWKFVGSIAHLQKLLCWRLASVPALRCQSRPSHIPAAFHGSQS